MAISYIDKEDGLIVVAMTDGTALKRTIAGKDVVVSVPSMYI